LAWFKALYAQIGTFVSQITAITVPINLTGLGSDATLSVGQRGYVTASAATSVPLNIATASGQIYEITMTGNLTSHNPSTFTMLEPNNSPVTNKFFYNSIFASEGAPGNNAGYANGFALEAVALNPLSARVTVWTSTAQKRVESTYDCFAGAPHYYTGIVSSRWLTTASTATTDDTTTLWTSLGTIVLPYAWTGTVTVERKF